MDVKDGVLYSPALLHPISNSYSRESNSHLEPGEVRAWGTVAWSKSRTEEHEHTCFEPTRDSLCGTPRNDRNTMGVGAKSLQSNR